jgi:uncharacterized integral membrane protein
LQVQEAPRVTDDDLDLDLDLEPEEPVKAKPVEQPQRKPAEDTPARKPAEASPTHKPAQAAPARKPGALARLGATIVAPLALLRTRTWDLKTFAYGLLALIILAILADNWALVRLNLFGLRFELPKAIAFLLDVALGALLMWLWLRRSPKAVESEK